jgi:hypothetical protein
MNRNEQRELDFRRRTLNVEANRAQFFFDGGRKFCCHKKIFFFYSACLRKAVIIKFGGMKIAGIVIVSVFCMAIMFQNYHVNILHQAIYVVLLLATIVKNIPLINLRNEHSKIDV